MIVPRRRRWMRDLGVRGEFEFESNAATTYQMRKAQGAGVI
jgi:hypothetical protein